MKILTFWVKRSIILGMKELTLKEFQDGMQIPITKLSKAELQAREDFWRAIWSWVDDSVKYYLYRVGQNVRVYMRTYRGKMGELGSVKFDMAELELEVYEKFFDEGAGKFFYEQKTIKVPASAVLWLETVTEREEAEVAEVPEVIGIESLVSEE